MAGLVLKNIDKIYDNGFKAVNDFNLDIDDKEFIVFVGPSGCGKSTTLRMIAGLEDISGGSLYIGDTLVNDVAPKDRDIAMVFQNYALYPHMTVYDNMAFGLKLRKISKDEIDKKVKDAAKILDIEHLLDRKPKALSGGQRQRVAMGRAIVRHPKVFLMDEPLSNLDAKLRVQMRIEISKLHQDLKTTFIYVTHDQTEAMTLGTRIVVMKDGIIQQVDTPTEIYNNPKNLFVATFIGSPQMNLVHGNIQNDKFSVFGELASISKEKFNILNKLSTKTDIIIGIRPENILINDNIPDSDKYISYNGTVEIVENLGSEIYVHIKKDNKTIIVKAPGNSPIKYGDTIKFAFDSTKLHAFDVETEQCLF
ncbi:MAG: ABC transporter ATP-binding protein [Sarcina sp.]